MKKILCVDDEANILQGLKRTLRGKFDIETASSGPAGIQAIKEHGPFSVIVSDMRMPEMNGVQFLTRAKELSPDSVRVMLTGNSDQQTASDAVNQGNIFRFLTKPCDSDLLVQTLNAAVEHHKLITAEKELLEGTLNTSLQVLVDVLSMVNPTAFSRTNRIKRMTREIAGKLGFHDCWEIEFAAMLSQIGCVSVPELILKKVASGEELLAEEKRLYQQHPVVGSKLISQIPRLDRVAEIIANQNRKIEDEAAGSFDPQDIEIIGARVLKVVLDFDRLIERESLPGVALDEMSSRYGSYDPDILEALKAFVEAGVDEFVNSEVGVRELVPGMLLNEAIYSDNETLLLSAGQEITPTLILRLAGFAEAKIISDRFRVRIPSAGNGLQV